MDSKNAETTDKAAETEEVEADTETEATDTPETPGLEGATAPVPFKLEVFRSGWTQEGDYPEWGIQGRAYDQSYVESLAKNTTKMMAEAGLKVPIVLNHPTGWLGVEQREAAEGWVLGLEVRELEDKDPRGRPELALVAEVIMEGQLKDDYDAGRLPKRSIGWTGEGKLPNGRTVGPYLQHLGLLGGRSQPAIPALQDGPLAASMHIPQGSHLTFYDQEVWTLSRKAAPVTKDEPGLLNKLSDVLKSFTASLGTIFGAGAAKQIQKTTAKVTKKLAMMEDGMTPDEQKELIGGIIEYFAAGMSKLQELADKLSEEEQAEGDAPMDEVPADDAPAASKAEDDMPPEEEEATSAKSAKSKPIPTPAEIRMRQELAAKDKALKELQARAAEDRFAQLAKDGQINVSHKANFIKVANTEGLSVAESYFAHEPVQRPVTGRVLGTPPTGGNTAAEIEAIKNKARQIHQDYGAGTATYKSEKARALALDPALESFFAELESPTPIVRTAEPVAKGA